MSEQENIATENPNEGNSNTELLELIKTLQADIASIKGNQQQQQPSATPTQIGIETSPQREQEMEDLYDVDDIDIYASQSDAFLSDNEGPEKETIFSNIKIINSEESKGDKISDEWAKIIKESFYSKKDKEDVKKLRESFPVPNNYSMPTPKLNVEIWQLLNSYQKRSDVSMSMIQRNIIAATSGVVSLVQDVISKNKIDKKKLIQKSTDIIGLLGVASKEVSLKRKLFIRSALKDEYKDLVSVNNNDEKIEKDSDKLFGDNLSDNIKDLKLRNKLKGASSNKSHNYKNRYEPYTKNNRLPFLGKGRRGMSSSTQTWKQAQAQTKSKRQ